MDLRGMALETEGLHTIESFSSTMNIQKKTGIVYIHMLRKSGFVKTMRGRRGNRLYDISPLRLRKVGSGGFIDIINQNSNMKIQRRYEHRIYGRDVTIEEAIIYALKTENSRIILASLRLFRKELDWKGLYTLAKKDRVERHLGALYDLSRRFFRVRKIDGRILRRMMETSVRKKYLVGKRKSHDFTDIEKKWKVHIPFNRSDMERLVM